MTECDQKSFAFSLVKRRKVEASFNGGDITGNAGALLLSEVDRRLGITQRAAKALGDERRRKSCEFSVKELIKQRIYALALGYEDLNDHLDLRHDLALQTAVSRDTQLASQSTLCRWEQRFDREKTIALHEGMFDLFVESFDKPPKKLVLDFDATDTPIHGEQEGRFFHGYYDRYCYLPLYVFCGRHLLVSYLRPSNIDPARHAWSILSLLVKALRHQWPKVKIVFRGDSGFCRHRMLSWCERHKVHYIVGIAKNSRLLKASKLWIDTAEQCFEATGKKQRLLASAYYSARSWRTVRRVIVKAEHSCFGSNPRFVVTNLFEFDRHLYDKVYCERGDMENRIKDQQLGLFAHRTLSSQWWSNQCRQLLSGLAYVLCEGLRRLGLKNTSLSKASPQTIRLKLLKIGAVITRNTRKIKLMMSSSCPLKNIFQQILLSITIDSS